MNGKDDFQRSNRFDDINDHLEPLCVVDCRRAVHGHEYKFARGNVMMLENGRGLDFGLEGDKGVDHGISDEMHAIGRDTMAL